MINMYFESVISIEDLEQKLGLRYIEFPDAVFDTLKRKHNLNTDPYFIKFLKEIDNCDIPMPNVARDLYTMDTHSFDKVSTGVRVLWLMARYPDKYLYPTQWLGENCYQSMFDLGKEFDISVYEDSDMFSQALIDECTGQFRDMHTGQIVTIDNDYGFDYVAMKNY